MNYTEDARYYQFVIESAIEHEKIQGFIKTISGVNEGASFKKLNSIHEDVGDKIRNLWDKFVAFLNRVWAKFKENCNRLIESNKGYLEQYKDIILNKKPESVDIEMRDYALGIKRITSTTIPTFSASKQFIKVDATDIAFKTHLIEGYTNANQDFYGFTVAYFQGGEDKKSTNLEQLHMTDLYNYCHDYDKIVSVIEKDKVTLSKTYTDIQSQVEKAKAPAATTTPPPATNTATTQPPAAAAAATNTAPKGSKENPNGEPGQGKIMKFDPDTKQYKWESSIDTFMGSYFNEGDGMTIGAAATPAPNSSANTAVTTGDTKAASNAKSLQTSNEPIKTEGEDLDTLTKQVANYNTDASAVLTAKKTSAEVIFKDYMKIIKLHVGHHVGNDGDTQVAKTGTDYRTALKITDPTGALNTIAQIESDKTDAATKSKLTSELNAKIQADNPNFPGGLEAIKAAATAANAPKK